MSLIGMPRVDRAKSALGIKQSRRRPVTPKRKAQAKKAKTDEAERREYIKRRQRETGRAVKFARASTKRTAAAESSEDDADADSDAVIPAAAAAVVTLEPRAEFKANTDASPSFDSTSEPTIEHIIKESDKSCARCKSADVPLNPVFFEANQGSDDTPISVLNRIDKHQFDDDSYGYNTYLCVACMHKAGAVLGAHATDVLRAMFLAAYVKWNAQRREIVRRQREKTQIAYLETIQAKRDELAGSAAAK